MASRKYTEKVTYEEVEYSFDFKTIGDRARFRDLWSEVTQDLDTPAHELVNTLSRPRLVRHALELAKQLKRLKENQQ